MSTFRHNLEQSSFFGQHQNLLQFFKFSLVGVVGTIVDFGTYAVLTRGLGLYYLYATALSVSLAICSNFILNKLWTFSKWRSGKTKNEYFKFFTVSVINYFLNIGITYIIVEFTSAEAAFGSYEDFFAKVIAIAVVLFGNFFGNKFWTFRD